MYIQGGQTFPNLHILSHSFSRNLHATWSWHLAKKPTLRFAHVTCISVLERFCTSEPRGNFANQKISKTLPLSSVYLFGTASISAASSRAPVWLSIMGRSKKNPEDNPPKLCHSCTTRLKTGSAIYHTGSVGKDCHIPRVRPFGDGTGRRFRGAPSPALVTGFG